MKLFNLMVLTFQVLAFALTPVNPSLAQTNSNVGTAVVVNPNDRFVIAFDQKETVMVYGEQSLLELKLSPVNGHVLPNAPVEWGIEDFILPPGLNMEDTYGSKVALFGTPEFTGEWCLAITAKVGNDVTKQPICLTGADNPNRRDYPITEITGLPSHLPLALTGYSYDEDVDFIDIDGNGGRDNITSAAIIYGQPPLGIYLDYDKHKIEFEGRAQEAGVAIFAVQVRNRGGYSVSKQFVLEVKEAQPRVTTVSVETYLNPCGYGYRRHKFLGYCYPVQRICSWNEYRSPYDGLCYPTPIYRPCHGYYSYGVCYPHRHYRHRVYTPSVQISFFSYRSLWDHPYPDTELFFHFNTYSTSSYVTYHRTTYHGHGVWVLSETYVVSTHHDYYYPSRRYDRWAHNRHRRHYSDNYYKSHNRHYNHRDQYRSRYTPARPGSGVPTPTTRSRVRSTPPPRPIPRGVTSGGNQPRTTRPNRPNRSGPSPSTGRQPRNPTRRQPTTTRPNPSTGRRPTTTRPNPPSTPRRQPSSRPNPPSTPRRQPSSRPNPPSTPRRQPSSRPNPPSTPRRQPSSRGGSSRPARRR